MLISLVLTIYNEVDVVDQFISEIERVFSESQYDYEAIFVDDSSTDGTVQKLIDHNKRNNKIKLIKMSRQFGRQPCFFAGLKVVKGDYVITMDCDLQDPPEHIPALIALAQKEEAHVIHTIMKKREGESFFKLFFINRGYELLSKISDFKSPKNGGWFKLFSQQAVEQILKAENKETFIKQISLGIGFKQVQYEFERKARNAGDTHYSMLGLRPYKDFLVQVTGFSYRPLYLFIWVSIICGALSLVGVTISMFMIGPFSFIKELLQSPVFMASCLLLSIFAFFMSLVGAYIAIIHREVRNFPSYIIESKHGIDD